jgi:hypothetical protein
MIKPLNFDNLEPEKIETVKKNEPKAGSNYADSFPDWSLVPQNQLINRVRRNA